MTAAMWWLLCIGVVLLWSGPTPVTGQQQADVVEDPDEIWEVIAGKSCKVHRLKVKRFFHHSFSLKLQI